MNNKEMLSPIVINWHTLLKLPLNSRNYYGHTNMEMNNSTTNNESRIFKYELSNAKSMFHFRVEFRSDISIIITSC